MSKHEKFEGFKQSLIDQNERKYGKEIRAKYGDEVINKSNVHLKGLSQEMYDESERLRMEFEKSIVAALETNDPAGEEAQRACELHKQWLTALYPGYDREYHLMLAEMYIGDERFKAHYENLAMGCAEFLYKAIKIYCQ